MAAEDHSEESETQQASNEENYNHNHNVSRWECLDDLFAYTTNLKIMWADCNGLSAAKDKNEYIASIRGAYEDLGNHKVDDKGEETDMLIPKKKKRKENMVVPVVVAPIMMIIMTMIQPSKPIYIIKQHTSNMNNNKMFNSKMLNNSKSIPQNNEQSQQNPQYSVSSVVKRRSSVLYNTGFRRQLIEYAYSCNKLYGYMCLNISLKNVKIKKNDIQIVKWDDNIDDEYETKENESNGVIIVQSNYYFCKQVVIKLIDQISNK